MTLYIINFINTCILIPGVVSNQKVMVEVKDSWDIPLDMNDKGNEVNNILFNSLVKYIEEYNLHEIYDEILNFPAIDLIEKSINSSYDLVIIGDCIEHMKKSEGIDLLNFLVYRSKYILIHYPNEYVQGTVDDHIHEAHISIWHESDFQAFDYKFIKNGFMHTYAIDGYLRKKSILNKLTSYDKSVLKILS